MILKFELDIKTEIHRGDVKILNSLIRRTQLKAEATNSLITKDRYQNQLRAFKTALNALNEIQQIKNIINGKAN
jgi:hypothetical protein